MRMGRAFAIDLRRSLGGLAAALLLLTAGPARAQAQMSEEAVEAAYLHKFPGFVEWPAEAFKAPGSPIVIGLAGAPKVLDELAKLVPGRLVLNRPVEVRAVESKDLPAGLHVLFIGREAAGSTKRWVEEARRAHVLVVTDVPEGLGAGGVLDFVRIDDRLRFDASIPAANRTGIKLSSKLLSVAAKVVEETP